METQKHKKGQVQVVKGTLVLIILLLILSWSKKEVQKNKENGKYEIVVFKSKKGYPYLTLQAFELKNGAKIPFSAYIINNLILDHPDSTLLNIDVLPGKFSIEATSIGGWKPLKSKDIVIKKGDSVSIKFYLEEEDPFGHYYPSIKNDKN